jgi:prepilin-type N-terminal cleavage/methylation domain-containing protein
MKRRQIVKGRLGNNRGFTLIEIIAVLVILAIIAAVVVSRGFSTDTYTLKGTTDVIKTHIRYAQTRAMSTNAVWGINFETTKTYSLFRDGSTANRVILPGQDSNIVTLPTNGPSVTSGVIVSFDLFGKPYTNAGATALQDAPRTITVSYGGTENITIYKNTGFIP